MHSLRSPTLPNKRDSFHSHLIIESYRFLQERQWCPNRSTKLPKTLRCRMRSPFAMRFKRKLLVPKLSPVYHLDNVKLNAR